jgi:hypothetical protein
VILVGDDNSVVVRLQHVRIDVEFLFDFQVWRQDHAAVGALDQVPHVQPDVHLVAQVVIAPLVRVVLEVRRLQAEGARQVVLLQVALYVGVVLLALSEAEVPVFGQNVLVLLERGQDFLQAAQVELQVFGVVDVDEIHELHQVLVAQLVLRALYNLQQFDQLVLVVADVAVVTLVLDALQQVDQLRVEFVSLFVRGVGKVEVEVEGALFVRGKVQEFRHFFSFRFLGTIGE